MITEELRAGIGVVLLSHRIGEIDATEARTILEGLLETNDMHAEVEKIRAARRRDDRNRTAATSKYALIG